MAHFAVSMAVVSLAVHFGIVCAATDLPHHFTTKEVYQRKYAARIINGNLAGPGEFPSQVSILAHGTHSFGGSILTDRWILTTSRVASGKPEDYTVLVGTNNLNGGGTFHRVMEVLKHLLYNESAGHVNDISMLKLRDPITLGNFAQVVPLYEGKLSEGMNAVVVGWGWYSPGYADISNNLRKVTLRISNHDECHFAYSGVGIDIRQTQICAEDPMGVAGPCRGDAGGALLVDGKVAGITSWNLGCVIEGYPNVFTDVSKYVQWIRNIIKFHP